MAQITYARIGQREAEEQEDNWLSTSQWEERTRRRHLDNKTTKTLFSTIEDGALVEHNNHNTREEHGSQKVISVTVNVVSSLAGDAERVATLVITA